MTEEDQQQIEKDLQSITQDLAQKMRVVVAGLRKLEEKQVRYLKLVEEARRNRMRPFGSQKFYDKAVKAVEEYNNQPKENG